MEHFDDIIKQYAKKIYDDENPSIFKYKLERQPHKLTHKVEKNLPDVVNDITKERQTRKREPGISGVRYETPFGIYNSADEAADACDIARVTLYLRIRKHIPGYNKLTDL